LNAGVGLRGQQSIIGCARDNSHDKSIWASVPLGGLRVILNNGSSSAPQRKVIAMSKHPVDQLSVCDCEYLIKTPECYLATGDLKRDRKTPFNLKAANKLEGKRHIVGNNRPNYPAQTRHDTRQARLRATRFAKAVEAAFNNDWPLTVAMTINWTALRLAGEHNEGHALGMADWVRDKYTRRELARCRPTVNSEQIPFVAIWARAIGPRLGLHTHYALFWPSANIIELSNLVARITGSSAAFNRAPYTYDEVSRSICHGWQIKMTNASDQKQAAIGWVGYLADQRSSHDSKTLLEGNKFGISKQLSCQVKS